jgi:anti-sigma B factor antagonist
MPQEPLVVEIVAGHSPSIRIVRLIGPLNLPNIFTLQPELARDRAPVTIFDLSGVPYMDSAGMGVIINYYVSAQGRGHKVIVAGASERVLELFKLTRVDTLIPIVATVEEADQP